MSKQQKRISEIAVLVDRRFCKMSPQLIGVIVGGVITIFIFVVTKLYEPFADYLGLSNPLDRKRRMDDYKYCVQRVVDLRDALTRIDAQPSSQLSKTWLQRVKDLEADKTIIQSRFDNVGGNHFKRWKVVRKATKELKRAEDLALQYKDLFLEPKPRPRPVKRVQLEKMLKMEPYKTMLFHFIKDKDCCLLGIWGMGGVGKSALLKLISTCRSEYADPEEYFEILLVHTGRDCTFPKVQKDICELLGLDVISSEGGQGDVICSYLEDKSFLLLLDDLWEPLDLTAVGIPDAPTTRALTQKVVLSSRMEVICSTMNCGQNIIHMVCPSEQVALDIFSDAVGPEVMNDERIPPLAHMIIEECGRLPEALRKIGLAMSSKRDVGDWEYTIELLRQSKLHIITHKNENLLDRLKWSYDQLEDSWKPGFLICSLWHEGDSIPLDKLFRWWRGMGLLDGPNAYIEGSYKVRELQNASLLEKGDNGLCTSERTHVKMHDMLRKMAMRIVIDSKEDWACNSSCRPALTEAKWYEVQKAWPSSKDIEVLERKRSVKKEHRSSQLTMLIIRHALYMEFNGLFANIVFLDLEGSPYTSFPLEICSMLKLQYLNLSSTRITEIPGTLVKLSKLKFLYLRDNCALRRIAEGVLGKLKNLEELDLFCTSSMRIKSLMKGLGSTVVDLSLIGFTVRSESELHELAQLQQVRAVSICLHQFDDEFINLQLLSEMKKCREICIIDSPNATELVAQGAQDILPYLQSFEISNLPNLRRVILSRTWMSVTTINVSNCGKLIDLGCIRQLVNLEQLTVSCCKKMEKVVSAIPGRNQDVVCLPKLKKIHLQELPELSIVSEVHLQLDSISHFCVVGCGKLIRLPVQQPNRTKVRLDCDAAWWNAVNAKIENQDMLESFRTHSSWM